MDIVKIPLINALGKNGSEKSCDLILKNSGFSAFNLQDIKINNSNLAESMNLIYNNSVEKFKNIGNKRIFFIGGDHSISFPLIRGFKDVFSPENCFLIVFDAHADCMPGMKEPTHEEWLRAVVENGFLCENIVIIGLRKIEPEEKLFLSKNKIKYFSGEESPEFIADYVTERAREKKVYISIDVDALDPAFAPGVNYPEPLGLTSKDFFYILKRFFHLPFLKALDIVEINSNIDEKYDLRTIKLAGKILSYENE
jgi:agmatinase